MILLREQVSPDAFGHYIISMTHDASHVLEVMLIAKMVGLVGKDKDDKYFCNILITPLFETIDDLARIKNILESFFQMTFIKSFCNVMMIIYRSYAWVL